MKISYDQGSQFIGHKFRKYLIEEEYEIISKPRISGNPLSNAILEWIQQVLGNLMRNCNITQTYVEKDYRWSGILVAVVFEIISTKNRLKGYSTVQLIFSHDMILSIKHQVEW